MKRKLNKAISILLASIMIFGAAPLAALAEIDLPDLPSLKLFDAKANAADESNLTFELINDGTEYEVSDCDESVSGEVVIPSTYKGLPVTGVNSSAFINCSKIGCIIFPDSITCINTYTFKYMNLIKFIVSEGNNCYSSDKYGALYNKEKTALIVYPAGNTRTYFEIPNSVTSINSMAFENCTSLTSVIIPNSVTSIGEGAFRNCTSLTSVTIPNSVTSIGDGAFKYCTSLTSVIIPNSVTSIGDGAFYGCTALTNIYISKDNEYYSSDDYGVLYNKDKTVLIQYPQGSNSASFEIPNSVTSIATYAFKGCSNLINIVIPDSVTNIGESAFSCCNQLSTVIIPDSILAIEDYAFAHCTSLTSVTIPNSVTSIDFEVFANCTSLTSVIIPNSVTSIDSLAFYGCTALTNISISKDNEYYSSDDYGVLYNKDKTELIRYPQGNKRETYEIPNSVTSIGDGAFGNCTSLTSVIIPNSVTSINSVAFVNCTSLTSVIIPNSVTSIGVGAFEYCTSIVSITIPNSVTDIREEAFCGCTSLEEFVVSEENEYFCTDSYGVLFNKDKTVLVSYPIGNDRPSYEIPYGVTKLAYFSFAYCINLSSIVLPTSVTNIDYFAFPHYYILREFYFIRCGLPNNDVFEEYSLKDVYYTGTQEQFEKIVIDDSNEVLLDAAWHYNYKVGDAEQTIQTVKPNDGSNSVSIEFPKGSFGENEGNMKLKVENITDSSEANKSDFRIKGQKLLALYKISPVDAQGNVIQPNGKVTVRIKAPSDYKNGDKVVVYHWPSGKSVEKLNGVVESGMIKVETSSFSEFGVYRQMTIWEKILDFFTSFFRNIFGK